MRRVFVLLILWSVARLGEAQTITAGSIPAPPYGVFPPGIVITVIDVTLPASGFGSMTSATFLWQTAPCPAAAKVKFFRPSGTTLLFLAERGPFDVSSTTQTVPLSPPVLVQAGDLVGVARVSSCGGPLTEAPPGATGNRGTGFFSGDVTSNVTLDSSSTIPRVLLALQATGQAAITGTVAKVVPVVISGPGQLGSLFRAALQAHNPGATPLTGSFIFHRQGVPGSPSDPSLPYALLPGQTLFFTDVVAALGQSGVGSLDVVPSTGTAAPIVSVRIYNDAGSQGTSGFTEEARNVSDALTSGQRAVLLGPFDTAAFRFNVGVRTLENGASIAVTVRDSSGFVVKALTRTYPANFFAQVDVAAFLDNTAIGPNHTITTEVTAGSLFLYGVTADNRTNDPAFQEAQRVP